MSCSEPEARPASHYSAHQCGLEILSFWNWHQVVSKEHVAELLVRTLLVRQANRNQDALQACIDLPVTWTLYICMSAGIHD